ncbi:MAG: hypothetical protein R2751_14560 [Bacteroidales bacterium]
MNALLLNIGFSPAAGGGRHRIGRYRDYILTHTDRSVLFVSILYIITLYCIFHPHRPADHHPVEPETTRPGEGNHPVSPGGIPAKAHGFSFEEGNRERARKELGSIASSPFNRQLLINEMIDLSINLKGEIREDIKELYLSLGLKKNVDEAAQPEMA